jgi:hypothetical protein
MGMRRSFLLAAVAVAAPVAALLAAHGCSSEQPFESVCLWVADPNNCYRKFHEDAVANGKDCKPFGDPSPAVFGGATGSPNGSFAARDKLDICLIGGGGSIVIDPPIDLTMFPPSLTSDPVTRKFTFMLPDGTECGYATYTSPHGFSFTIDAPPDAGASASSSSSSSTGGVDAGDAGTPEPYGTYTSFISPGRDAFDVTCPSGESHHFDLVEVASPTDAVDGGGAVSSCPLFADVVPRASLVINPGGINIAGAVSFTIVWPPDTAVYPPTATQQDGGVPVVPQFVTYFNCSIPGALPHCTDGQKDDSETDVDCGGNEISPGCPARCGDGQGCITDCDCGGGEVCTVKMGVKVCGVSPTEAGAPDCSSVFICQDHKKNGAESDIDCGGPDCPACPDGKTCTGDTDCANGYCLNLKCATATCTDMIKNQGESDVDCGGPMTCPRCPDAKTCAADADCLHNFCKAGLCATADCSDMIKNGNETDVDCGGGCTTKCANTKGCLVNADCMSNACVMGVCLVPQCNDNVKDGDETDKDCGGSCGTKCGDGLLCGVNVDCANGVCGPSSVTASGVVSTCFPATCGNLMPDPMETDVDCGGGKCPLCVNGKICMANTDCVSNGCVNNKCAAPACNDGVQDGTEPDVDCGSMCPTKCAVGQKCVANTDCAGIGMCINKICQ